MEKQHFTPGDPVLVENIVNYLKAKGIFDEFRHECLADVDTKSSCQNLNQRVDGYTTKFLSNETWNPDLNKNELRNKLRRQIDESGMLSVGTDHVVEQVINPKIGQLFLPRIIEVVYQYIKEETEKLNSKQEITNESLSTEKASENSEGNSKTKTPVIDPIADILSFTYPKPKSTSTNVAQKPESAHKKSLDVATKIERKKDDVFLAAKNTDVVPKLEKKEEENIQSIKTTEMVIKSESKENAIQTKDLDIIGNLEKSIDENAVKIESNESSNDNTSITSKLQNDPKDTKSKKETKSEESESQLDIQKKIQKENLKLEKKKSEDLKPNEESALLNDTTKSHNSSSKSSSQNKIKIDTDKSKKLKVHTSHKSSNSDKGKSKSKESFDKHSKSSSSKIFKSSLKDQPPSAKSDSSKSSKKDKSDDDNLKVKSSDSSSNKLSDYSSKKSSSKSNSTKKDISSLKNKLTSDKHAKNKLFKKQNSKPEIEQQSSSTSADKGNKIILSSSSHESSQGSDQEKTNLVVEDSSKKLKHYSKHKKENFTSDKNTDSKHSKDMHDLKRSKKDSGNNLSKKHKNEKPSISVKRKMKESKGLSHDSAKICSRSNSFGSTSSISDSSNFSKEALPSSSEDMSENSNKQRESKKKVSEKNSCSSPQNFPPPPPPPPPSADLPITESTSSSPEDTTQSSQDSESGSEDHSESDSDADSCSSNVQTSSQNSGIESDLFLYESSSSEFEGFSSPERGKERASVSDSVSSVHTSDLSSFEDDISIEDLSGEELPLSPDLKAKRKLPLRKAQELLDEKVCINFDVEKPVLKQEPVNEKLTPVEEKLSETNLPISVSSSYEEISPQPEPRRELRRERKLNPKYASNEYTSIFTSKRTSFITRQMNLSPQKQTLNASFIGTLYDSSETTPKKDGLAKNVDNNEPIQGKCLAGSNKIEVHSEPNVEVVSSKNSNWESGKDTIKDTDSVSEEKVSLNSHNLSKNNSSNRLTLNVKNSEIKANNISKNSNSNLVKRKHEETEKITNKRICRRNSADSSSSKNGANENKPFNNEKMNKSVNIALISKKNIQKPKANGDILNKIEHLRKSSHTKSSHTSD